jgi:predicted metal-dependent hydrolase
VIDWLRRPTKARPRATATRRTLTVAGRALPLVIRPHATARRLTLRLAPDGSEARVTMPRWGRAAEAERFARERSDWLAAQLAALPEREVVRAGGALAFRGERLAVVHEPTAPRKPVLDDGAVVIGGPEGALATRLQRWLEAEALRLFAADAADYAHRGGVAVPVVRLSRARRRWGSCARDGTLRLNWRLAMAPDFVRRSVVAHEVAHLVHFDHGARFHALLGELYEGDMAAANRWLKREGRGLYAPFG